MHINFQMGGIKQSGRRNSLNNHLPFQAKNSRKKQKHGIVIIYTNRIDINKPDIFNIDI